MEDRTLRPSRNLLTGAYVKKKMIPDLRYGLRALRTNPGFTAVAIITLAIGIGANTAIYSIVQGVLLRSLPYREPDRLVMLWERSPRRGFEQEPVSPPNLADWRAGSQTLEHLSYWSGATEFNLVNQDGTE